MFDVLRYIRVLERSGVPGQQAVTHVQLIVDIINSELTTRADFAELRGEFVELRGEFAELRGEFAELRGELRGDLAVLRGEFATLAARVDSLEARLMMKLGGLMVALFTVGSGVMGLVMGYIIKHT